MASARWGAPGGGGRPAVPGLGLEGQLVSKKPIATNDEVASILKGLCLDRKFFMGRLDEGQTKDLLLSGDAPQDETQPDAPDASQKRRVTRMKTKVMKTRQNRAVAKSSTDFDIYLGEALMPVLAQALDSLCRQINLMQLQGDSLDPKVRSRFNPLTWLAQQLLRRHPKGAKTPRRQAIYANFRDWSDLERGRREMLRRREVVQDVFKGFVLRGVVQRAHLPRVVDAIDDTLRLDGVLKNNQDMRSALYPEGDPDTPHNGRAASPSPRPPRDRNDFFKDGGWTFDQFWQRFAQVLMASDVVPFSVIQQGIKQANAKALLLSDAEDARKREVEERKQMEIDQRRQMEEYTALHAEMQENEHILAIRNDGKVLTGDDVRPGDAGFEFEVPPNGLHVKMLFRFLILMGFEWLDKEKEQNKPKTPNAAVVPEAAATLSGAVNAAPAAEVGMRWWDDELAQTWTTVQQIHNMEICDGVVEAECLEKVLVPPVAYILLRNKVMEELENREDQDPLAMGRESRRASGVDTEVLHTISKKPSIDTLCQRLGITMSRMEWLHHLFESYLTPDENDPTKVPTCLYPEFPAAIKKVQMRQLMKEVRPSMEEVEFEMRFRRIDQDMSNEVEFDEFVTWVREDEVRVAGAAPLNKMSFEELSVVYGEHVDLIKYLHHQFQDRFPEDEKDNYPSTPRALPKSDVRALVTSLTPSMSDAEFESQFQMTTFSKKDGLEFDEFLEVVPLDELPDEIRDHHDDDHEG